MFNQCIRYVRIAILRACRDDPRCGRQLFPAAIVEQHASPGRLPGAHQRASEGDRPATHAHRYTLRSFRFGLLTLLVIFVLFPFAFIVILPFVYFMFMCLSSSSRAFLCSSLVDDQNFWYMANCGFG